MLTLTNVNKTYADGTQALNNISLTLPSGMVGLLGPNGAGKSSLMRTLACLQTPDSGTMYFDGLDLLRHPEDLRQQLGYLPQYFGVYPNMSCRALLEHIAVLKGLGKAERSAQINSLLALTNLSQFAHKKVHDFSGGMRQRFGIAQALLGDPKLIIMDEPTAGLDPMERESLNHLLVSISKDKLILLSTHIVEDVENLCHHVAMINHGRLIECGDVQSLILPLKNRVWHLSSVPQDIPTHHILSKNYRFGQSAFRVFSEHQPAVDANLVAASLQDKYFLELNLEAMPPC